MQYSKGDVCCTASKLQQSIAFEIRIIQSQNPFSLVEIVRSLWFSGEKHYVRVNTRRIDETPDHHGKLTSSTEKAFFLQFWNGPRAKCVFSFWTWMNELGQRISVTLWARLTRSEGRGHKKFPKGPPFADVYWKNFKKNYQRGGGVLAFSPPPRFGGVEAWSPAPPPPLNAPLCYSTLIFFACKKCAV